VLVTEPEVLVCDEPTTLLDLRNAERIAGVLDDLPQQVVLVTHQLDLVLSYQRVLVVDDGRIAFDGEPVAAVHTYRRLMQAAR
jgi:biotin transport system ATP-binding protein